MIVVTPLYAALLASLFVVLSVRVIRARRRFRVGLGDGGEVLLQRRIRTQANFAEYVPLTLLLLTMGELQGAPAWALHAIGATLLFGRVLHSLGVSREPEPANLRVLGMASTFTALSSAVLLCLVLLSWDRLF